ncbi:hypothetical protein SI65_03167 [Aspergillus cristatus]|uniref:Uncharacterized protein n=1 Tax=Aspergillus cristatus TaxID=573508 RepID=A0A1E3BNE8_ASPCR|nr:hypothetical protein SI65_03167 [Aspergillus cristatus]
MGILAKELLESSIPNGLEVKAKISKEMIRTVDPSTKTVANQLGMSIVDQLKDLSEDIQQLQAARNDNRGELNSLREQNLDNDDLFIVRASTLDEWADGRGPVFDDDRNDRVHAGRLQIDVKTVLCLFRTVGA